MDYSFTYACHELVALLLAGLINHMDYKVALHVLICNKAN